MLPVRCSSRPTRHYANLLADNRDFLAAYIFAEHQSNLRTIWRLSGLSWISASALSIQSYFASALNTLVSPQRMCVRSWARYAFVKLNLALFGKTRREKAADCGVILADCLVTSNQCALKSGLGCMSWTSAAYTTRHFTRLCSHSIWTELYPPSLCDTIKM